MDESYSCELWATSTLQMLSAHVQNGIYELKCEFMGHRQRVLLLNPDVFETSSVALCSWKKTQEYLEKLSVLCEGSSVP